MIRGGTNHRSVWCRRCIIVLLAVIFLMPAPKPAQALNTDLAIGSTILGVLATPLIAYGVWRNLPQNQGQEGWLNGEFYAGCYLGAAFTPSQNLKYPDGISLYQGGGVTTQGPVTLFGNKFQPAVVGGFKFGYFFHDLPYLGLEVETNVNRSAVRSAGLATSRAINGATQAIVPNNKWFNWTTALHIVGRYGFLPDKEVPFGRLQPYLGIGPGFVINYATSDSAKNFGVDTEAGVRYMLLKNVSAFVEYKFNYIWDAEIEDHDFNLPNGTLGRGTAHFDYVTHKVVLGVAYHF
jgi:opacity protein-like surface antigen